MLLIKLLLSSSSFLLLLLLLTVVVVFTLELRANFIRIIRELFAFLWGWPNITYTPEATLARLAALDLLYFARYLCNFFITIFIIYYCLPLIGYVLIFCFFFELKFKFKFVRRFFWRRNGIGDGFRGWLGGLLQAGNGATGARDELQTATVGSHWLRAAFLINFRWMLRVSFNRVQLQFQPSSTSTGSATAHATQKGRQNSFMKSNS